MLLRPPTCQSACLKLHSSAGVGLPPRVRLASSSIGGLSRLVLTRKDSFKSTSSPPSPLILDPRKVCRSITCLSMATSTDVFAHQYRVMLVSDLDNTMVDHKDPEHKDLKSFGAVWQELYAEDSLLVYSTGRSPTLYKELKSHTPLLTPDVVIMSVGTEVSYGGPDSPDRDWERYLDEGWNREIVVEEAKKFGKLKFQRDSEQRPHKVSFNVEKADALPIVDALKQKLQDRGLQVKLIYSGGYDLDILPARAGKGEALAYLLRRFAEAGHTPACTLACGDSGNDVELFQVAGANGVIVANAMEELVQWAAQQPASDHIFRATRRCAGGILQALEHFGCGNKA